MLSEKEVRERAKGHSQIIDEHIEGNIDIADKASNSIFGSYYDFDGKNYLVSCSNGAGLKSKIASELNIHGTIGMDCVAMCINDVVSFGAKPLFFMDYFSTGKMHDVSAEQVVDGMAKCCDRAGVAFIGGQMVKLEEFHDFGEYNLSGFAVGKVEKDKLIDGRKIVAGNVLIGLKSSGIHTNGFSLIRKSVKFEIEMLNAYIDAFSKSFGEELLTPTRIYSDIVLRLIDKYSVKGIANIKSGGVVECLPKILPKGLDANICIDAIDKMNIFEVLLKECKVDRRSAFSIFNMGIGMVMVVGECEKDQIMEEVESFGQEAFVLGKVVDGENSVNLIG